MLPSLFQNNLWNILTSESVVLVGLRVIIRTKITEVEPLFGWANQNLLRSDALVSAHRQCIQVEPRLDFMMPAKFCNARISHVIGFEVLKVYRKLGTLRGQDRPLVKVFLQYQCQLSTSLCHINTRLLVLISVVVKVITGIDKKQTCTVQGLLQLNL